MKKEQRRKLENLLKISFPTADSVQLESTIIEVGRTPLVMTTVGSFQGVQNLHATSSSVLSINFTLTHTAKTMADFIKSAEPYLSDCRSNLLYGSIARRSCSEDILNQTTVNQYTITVPTNSLDEFIEELENDLKIAIHEAFYTSVEEVLTED